MLEQVFELILLRIIIMIKKKIILCRVSSVLMVFKNKLLSKVTLGLEVSLLKLDI